MASGEFTSEICERLYAAPKHVASRIRWTPGNGNMVLIFRAHVLTVDGIALDLSGYWKQIGRHNSTRWGFSLKHMGHCIRTYDMAASHKNPGEHGRIKGPHKHKFSSSKIDRYAYKPDPPLSDSDPNQSLMDFLKESNIELPIGQYQDFMFPCA